MNRFSLEIALFPGFYGSIFDADDNLYYEIQEEVEYYREERNIEIDPDKFDFDYKAYMHDVGVLYTDYFFNLYAKKISFIKSIEFDSIDSPREYNFRNDELYAFFEFTDNWKDSMRDWMIENKTWLADIIRKNWSSRDGFISFISNDVDDWFTEIFVNEDTRYIGTMIYYMIVKDNDADEINNDLTMYVWEDIYIGEYLEYTGEEKELVKVE